MCDDPDDLNYDCNYNMFLAKTMLSNLRLQQDRVKAQRWLRKLSLCNRSLQEMKLRNDFMYHLVLNIQSGELQPPFSQNPPAGPLPTIAQLLPGGTEASYQAQIDTSAGLWASDVDKASAQRPMLYRTSPDGGAFLAAQPVPKVGAFCYLAVVSKDTGNKNENG
ncbi:uncharacterized protein [Rhodnius prolixus]|uniref:uncharacterized protein n=1 Tax=Rhodnius prolixus TaxID=13249 RepID=UPI003D18A4FA